MAMRFEKEKVSAEGSKMAIGSPGIDSAGNATLERIEDELGRTQRGNNNAYCQDNELSWINWDLNEHDYKLLEFTLPGALWRLYLLHEWYHRDPGLVESRYAQGQRAPIIVVFMKVCLHIWKATRKNG